MVCELGGRVLVQSGHEPLSRAYGRGTIGRGWWLICSRSLEAGSGSGLKVGSGSGLKVGSGSGPAVEVGSGVVVGVGSVAALGK